MEKESFLTACREHHFDISDEQAELLQAFVDAIRSHNKHINLISRKDEENIWERHVLHCVSLLFHRKFPPGTRILDLGTGGGFPGIVFAILCTENTFTLLDATRKKINAVQDMVEKLGLTNVTTVWGRTEVIGKMPEYAGRFDIVVARAVAPLRKLVRWSRPFLNLKSDSDVKNSGLILLGSLVAFKGGDIDEELNQIRKIKSVKYVDSLLLTEKEDKKVLLFQLL